jgi:hypothetical protein
MTNQSIAESFSWLQPHKLLIVLIAVFVERRAAAYLSSILLLFTAALLCPPIRSALSLNAEVQQHHDAIAIVFLFAFVALPFQIFYRYPIWSAQRRQKRELGGW